MNLGQAFGIMQLRIYQLEDELERRNIRLVEAPREVRPQPEPPGPARIEEIMSRPGRGRDRGIGARVRAALPEGPPGLRICELAERLPDIQRRSISAYLALFGDVAHEGERGYFRYYRKRAA